MIPTREIRNLAMELLSADTGSLAAGTANKIHLFANNATPAESSVLADFTPATFAGSAAIAGVAGAQPEGYNPTTDASEILIAPPAGGYKWICATDPASPEDIYGFYLTDNAGAVLLGAERFADAPRTISSAGQIIELDAVKLSLLPNSIS